MSVTFAAYDFSRIDSIQDPVFETYVEKDVFFQTYGPLLETLDGSDMTSFFDFFFAPSPVAGHVLLFQDEDAKLDFRDLAEDLGLVPALKEVMEGEDAVDKLARKKQEARSHHQHHTQQKLKLQAKRQDGQLVAALKRNAQAQRTVDKLLKRLERENDPSARRTLDAKIARAMSLVDKTV